MHCIELAVANFAEPNLTSNFTVTPRPCEGETRTKKAYVPLLCSTVSRLVKCQIGQRKSNRRVRLTRQCLNPWSAGVVRSETLGQTKGEGAKMQGFDPLYWRISKLKKSEKKIRWAFLNFFCLAVQIEKPKLRQRKKERNGYEYVMLCQGKSGKWRRAHAEPGDGANVKGIEEERKTCQTSLIQTTKNGRSFTLLQIRLWVRKKPRRKQL